MSSGGTILSVIPHGNSRFCIYFSSQTHAFVLLELSSKDVTMVRITSTRWGSQKELIVTSAYLPYYTDEPSPNKDPRDVINYCSSRGKQHIIGCDTKCTPHYMGKHTIRGESMMEYVLSLKLNILHQGNKHTFVIHNRKEVTDVY